MRGAWWSKEWVRSAALAILIIGVIAAAAGAFLFLSASIQINQNPAYQAITQNQPINPQSSSETQGLIAAGTQLRALSAQQDQGLILIGAGLVLVAVGYLSRDFIQSRLRSQPGAPKQPNT